MPQNVPPPSGTADTRSNGIDVAAFLQILELDDPGTHHAFSKNMIEVYFGQAVDAFSRLDAALAAENLTELVDCAHFLAGSSATLGVARVAAACSHIEAAKVAEDSGRGSGRQAACAQIRTLLAEARTSYAAAETWLRRWYAECGAGFDDEPAIVEPVMATGSMTSTPVPVPESTGESRASAAAAAKPRATDAVPPLPLQPSGCRPVALSSQSPSIPGFPFPR